MRIIKDTDKQINIHPLVVYFVLSPRLKDKYEYALNKLNKYSGFTRRIFKFNIVSHIGNSDGSVLSAELQKSMKRYNMMVRLVDDSAGNFYYALHQVNFNRQANVVEASIQRFIIDVCKQNLKHLDERLNTYSSSTEDISYRLDAVEKMRSAFRDAIVLKYFKHGVWKKLNDPMQEYSPSLGYSYMVPHDAIEKLKAAGFTKPQAELAVQTIWDLVESEFNLPSEEDSNAIAAGVVDINHSQDIVREQKRRIKPPQTPTIFAEIKRVTSRRLKSGREKKDWGVEFTINGDVFPIYFGSKDCTMIYICSLLRTKVGERLYIHEFFNNSKGFNSKYKREKSKAWLKEVYITIFSSHNSTFDDWISKVEDGRGHMLNQGKSRCSNLIEEKLEDQSDAIYYCILDTKNDQLGDSFYEIRIKPENITVPEELSYLVDDFYSIMKMESPDQAVKE